MLAKPTLKRATPEPDESPRQARPVEDRYVVKVDGQAKRSFPSKDSATAWGGEIKKKFPLVIVTISDSKEATTEQV